jgi:hypothetical protein
MVFVFFSNISPLVHRYYKLFCLIVGDSAYSLEPYLMKPYSDTTADPAEKNFNFLHSSTRMTIENCNGRLKGKWRRLFDIQVHSVTRGRLIVRSCIVLHNFVLIHDTDSTLLVQHAVMDDVVNFADAGAKRDYIKNKLPRVQV